MKKLLQFIKFALFSASAGIIQAGSFTLMNEVLIKTAFFASLIENHPALARIMENEYGPVYLTALILSVIWNFTFNRKFTFKSAGNIPIAMLKTLGFYAVFTPVSVILGNFFTQKFSSLFAIEYIVLAVTMLCNMITDFLFDKYIVFKDSEANDSH